MEVLSAIGLEASCEPVAASPELEAALAEDLAPLAQLEPDLPGRALAFVLWGEDDGLLALLSKAAPRPGQLLGLKIEASGLSYAELRRVRDVFRAPGVAAPSLLVRLGNLYQACSTATSPEDKVPGWFRTLADEAKSGSRRGWGGHGEAGFTADVAGRALAFAGADPEEFLREVLLDTRRGNYLAYAFGADYGGSAPPALARALQMWPGPLRTTLRESSASRRAQSLELLARLGAETAEPWIEEVALCAVGEASSVRIAAAPLCEALPEQARPHLRRLLAEGKATQRAQAARLLGTIGAADEAAGLRERVASDRSKKVRAACQAALTRLERRLQRGAPAQDSELQPLGAEPRGVFAECFARFPPKRVDAAWTLLSDPRPWSTPDRKRVLGSPDERTMFWLARRELSPLVRLPELAPGHVARLVWLCGGLHDWQTRDEGRWSFGLLDELLQENLAARGAQSDLAPALSALESVGVAAHSLAIVSLYPQSFSRSFDPATWTGWGAYLTGSPGLLTRALENASAAVGSWGTSLASHLAAVLEQLETIPPPDADFLLSLALGKNKSLRCVTQGRLSREPWVEERLVAELQASKQDLRIHAATWLAQLGAASALPPLQAALAREKRPKARVALEAAIAALSSPA